MDNWIEKAFIRIYNQLGILCVGKVWICIGTVMVTAFFLINNRNFGENSRFWSKVEILFKIRNFGQKSKFCSTVQMLVKRPNFGQKSKCVQNPKLWSKTHKKFYQNSDFL